MKKILVGTYMGFFITDFRIANTSRYTSAARIGHQKFESGVIPRCH